MVTPPPVPAPPPVWGSQKIMPMARYISMAVDSSARACSCRPAWAYQAAKVTVAVGLERTHAQLLGQCEGLAVMSGSLVDL